MSLLRRRLAGIVLSMAGAATPALACSQHRSDAAAYPCSTYDKLVVRQISQDFAITRLDPATFTQIEPASHTPAKIAIGAALKIDRSIFLPSLLKMAGGSDARR